MGRKLVLKIEPAPDTHSLELMEASGLLLLMFSTDTMPLPREHAKDPSQCLHESLHLSKFAPAGRLGFLLPCPVQKRWQDVSRQMESHLVCLTGTLTISPVTSFNA